MAHELGGGVVSIHSNSNAFAATKDVGGVVTWGNPGHGGDSSAVADELSGGVVSLHSTAWALAALRPVSALEVPPLCPG